MNYIIISELNFINDSHSSILVFLLKQTLVFIYIIRFQYNHTTILYSESPSTMIRHAGYLHKRSNFPYVASSMHGRPDLISNLAPLPDLLCDTNTIIPLPIFDEGGGGVPVGECSTGESKTTFYALGGDPAVAIATITPTAVLDATADTTLEKEDDDTANNTNDNPCFCSPLLQYFGHLFRAKPSANALLSDSNNAWGSDFDYNNNNNTYASGDANGSLEYARTQPLLISSPNMNGGESKSAKYNIPLKGPSGPLPISPRGKIATQPQRIGGSGQKMPRSHSHGGGSVRTTNTANTASATTTGYNSTVTNVTTTTITTPKQYPPPPDDYIDPKDNHIWRAKYCVLEDGILYFYRNAKEGESDEAQAERNESRKIQSVQSEDIQQVDDGPGGRQTIGYGGSASSPRGSSLAMPIPSGAASQAASAAQMAMGSRIISGNDRKTSQHDLHDLSMSPMPRKKSDFDFANSPFHRSASTVSGGGGISSPTVLTHSVSTATFNHDADILWEKRVALDCVGAVRSSEQEYGDHAIELLAFGYDERISGGGESDASTYTGGLGKDTQHEIVDRLILRAVSSDEMNTWLFEFHRSLSSFMKQLFNSVKKGDAFGHPTPTGHLQTINHLGMRQHNHRPESPVGHHHRHGSKGGVPFAKQSSSPTADSFGGSLGTKFLGSLSHGHGRNAIYRTRVRDNIRDNAFISPVSTPGGTPGGGSPVDIQTKPLTKPLLPLMTHSDLVKPTMKAKGICPREGGDKVKASPQKYIPPALRKKAHGDTKKSFGIKAPIDNESKDVSKPKLKADGATETNILGQETELAQVGGDGATSSSVLDKSISGTAISPTSSLLSRQLEDTGDGGDKVKAAPRKYIPPALRKKAPGAAHKSLGNKTPKDNEPEDVSEPKFKADGATEEEVSESQMHYERITQEGRDGLTSSSVLDESVSETAISSTSSLLSRQLDDTRDASAPANVRLGGCADPTIIVGSILDKHFIPRKSSVVGNARLEAFGGVGGGLYAISRIKEVESMHMGNMDLDSAEQQSDENFNTQSVLKWEVGAASECGIRDSNEDAYVAVGNLDKMMSSQGMDRDGEGFSMESSQHGLYAIFDGHVGNHAARFSAEKFPGILIEEQSLLASGNLVQSIEERAATVLRKALTRLDREFCQLCMTGGRDWDCGSTALAALIVDDTVSLANLGDCRGVVCRVVGQTPKQNTSNEVDTEGWEILDLDDKEDDRWDRANGGGALEIGTLYWKEITEIHSPLLHEERARIENANGWILHETEIPTGQLHRMDLFDKDVVDIVKRCFADRLKQHRSDPARQIQIGRTCGDLAVSRAIGDRDFKAAYNLPQSLISFENTELSMSWEGPPVFIYPEKHSGRFKGDLVSNVPDIKSFKVGQEGVIDEFLLMACDGLWDVMDGDDAVRIAKDLLFDKKLSAKDGVSIIETCLAYIIS